MELIKKNMFEEMIGVADIDEAIKKKLTLEPKLRNNVEKWIGKHLGSPQISTVKICNVDYINYEELNLDEIEDEFEYKEIIQKIKNNNRQCPNHMSCPLYLSNSIVKNDKCLLELMDTEYLTTGLMNELDITEFEFNDKITVGQLVSLNLIYTRAMRGLSCEPLVQEIKIMSKGEVKFETKVNENWAIIERTVVLMEKIRKNLILNREDKARFKQIKKANDELESRRNVEKIIKTFQDEIVIDDSIEFEDIEG